MSIEIGAFYMRCTAGAHKQLAHAFGWPVGHEVKHYLKTGHEVVTRVIGHKRNRPMCAAVYWCQPPNLQREVKP